MYVRFCACKMFDEMLEWIQDLERKRNARKIGKPTGKGTCKWWKRPAHAFQCNFDSVVFFVSWFLFLRVVWKGHAQAFDLMHALWSGWFYVYWFIVQLAFLNVFKFSTFVLLLHCAVVINCLMSILGLFLLTLKFGLCYVILQDELLNEVIKECSENFLALQSLIR